MTIEPTHQSADGRKFVFVGKLPVPSDCAPYVWQDVSSGVVIHRYADGRFYKDAGGSSADLTPIPKPEVRWYIKREFDDRLHGPYPCKQMVCAGPRLEYQLCISTLNGVRTASIEAP